MLALACPSMMLILDFGIPSSSAISVWDMPLELILSTSLNNNAYGLSALMEKWMMRQGKLTHPEEDELGNKLLTMDEKYLNIQEVKVKRDQDFESSKIVECIQCNDLIPEGLISLVNNRTTCMVCSGQGYCRVI
jgi:formylmethanofuran dehydrogenase subunit E